MEILNFDIDDGHQNHNQNHSLTFDEPSHANFYGNGSDNMADVDYEEFLPPWLSTSTEGPSSSPPPPPDAHSPWFLAYGLGITVIAILGIFGNLFSALVLSRPQMRSSVTCLLLGLAFCDTLLISISILIFGLPSISDYTGFMLGYRFHFYPLWVQYLYPISITAQTGSVYLTLSVTIERYVAVCYSLHARSLCTWSRARACVLAVMLLATAYNSPRWFEVCVVETEFRFEDNSSVYENVMCPLRSSWAYKTYYINWSYLLVMYLVPFLGLVILNWAIYQQVRRANLARQILSKHQRREMGLATMLLFVVSVFLLCNVLPLVNNVLESFYDTSSDTLVQISNFLVIFNSSVNFVIYCTCGERFRRRLVRMCKEWYGWVVKGACTRTRGREGAGDYQLGTRSHTHTHHWRRGKSMSSAAGHGHGHDLNRLGNGNGPGDRNRNRSRGSVNGTMTIRLRDSDLRRDTVVSFQETQPHLSAASARLHVGGGGATDKNSHPVSRYFNGGGKGRALSRERESPDNDSMSSTSFTRTGTRETPTPSPSRSPLSMNPAPAPTSVSTNIKPVVQNCSSQNLSPAFI